MNTGNGDGASKSEAARSRRGGPKTEGGKQRSKHNATRHGIFSTQLLIAGESSREFKKLLDEVWEDVQPVGFAQELCATKIAETYWLMRRKSRAEAAEIDRSRLFLHSEQSKKEADEADLYCLGPLIKYISNSRVLVRCIEDLEDLRKSIEKHGFQEASDKGVLQGIYGLAAHLEFGPLECYVIVLQMSRASDEERARLKYFSPEECKQRMLLVIKEEIERLTEYKEHSAEVQSQRDEFELQARSVLAGKDLKRFTRYDATLDRKLERYFRLLRELRKEATTI